LEKLIDVAFFVAGGCVAGHVVFCMVLLRQLEDREELIRELFAVPNQLLARDKSSSPRLLRLRYYLPWRKPPLPWHLSFSERLLLFASSASGILIPAAFAFFFGALFMQSGQ
jgi:hypothetical protein